jgi:two-component system OmpR family response regulator
MFGAIVTDTVSLSSHGVSMTEANATAAHLLVVDDDPRVRAMLVRYFQTNGYQVTMAENAAQLRQKLSNSIDLILLDLGLPDEDGLTLAREIRAVSRTAIIIVSGRSDDIDRIVGLEVGADDYISKPFNLREVLARVKSVLRRTQTAAPVPDAPAEEALLRFDDWTLNTDRRELTSPDGEDIALTTGEFELLLVFVNNAGRVLTRDFLMDQTRGRTWEAFDRAIDAQVTRLRRKLLDDGANPTRIKSIRGVGYLFTPRVQRGGISS